MMKSRTITLALLLLVLLFGGVYEASAQGGGPGEPSADEVNAIAKNLYCPVCEGVPLDACGTLACDQWRQQIADKLVAGYSEEEIYDFFVDQYGDRVLAAPPPRGLNWLIYVVPPAAILAGGWVYYRTVVKGRETAEQTPPAGGKPNAKSKDPYLDELERELEQRR